MHEENAAKPATTLLRRSLVDGALGTPADARHHLDHHEEVLSKAIGGPVAKPTNRILTSQADPLPGQLRHEQQNKPLTG